MLDTIRYSDYEQIKDTKVANDRMWKKINGGLDDDQKALLKHIKDQKKKYAHLTKK